MVVGHTLLGLDFTVMHSKSLPEIDGGAALPHPEGNDPSDGRTSQEAETTTSQKSRDLKGIILGTENQPFSFSISHLRKSL
ncbi:MAG: hypothetical protein ACI9R3_001536 [Verrucomicrobiales bacterium]|jgi:hypothetical protein